MDDPPVVVVPDGNGSVADDGTAVFAVESQICSRHLMWGEHHEILRRSLLAELTGRGLDAEYMDSLLACAIVNLPALNEQRRIALDEVSA